MRADQSDVMKRVELLIREKVKVASFAQAPGEKVIKTLKDAGVLTMPTIGARRHAEKVQAWGVDAVIAQGQEGGGHTGQIPTSISDSGRLGGRRHPGRRRRRLPRWAWPRGGVGARRRGHRDGDALLADAGKPGARPRETDLPRHQGERHRRDQGGRRPPAARHPNVPHRPAREGEPSDALPARGPQRLVADEGHRNLASRAARRRHGDEAEPGAHLGTTRDGRQRTHADQGVDGRRQGRGRHSADGSDRRRHRRNPNGRRAPRRIMAEAEETLERLGA